MSSSSNSKNTGYFLLGISLGLALVISSLLFTDTLKFLKSNNQTIRVKGYAEKKIVSDLAIWSIAVTATAENQQLAYASIEKDLQTVRQYLLSNDVDESAISIEPINTQEFAEQQGNSYAQTGRVLAYKLTQVVTIETKNVQLVAKLSGQATELLKVGVHFEPYQPNYHYTKLNDLKIEMLGLAAEDAYNRANQLANNSGSAIGHLASAQQGVFQITSQKSSTDVDDYGIYDLSGIDKTIKAVVTMEYTIE